MSYQQHDDLEDLWADVDRPPAGDSGGRSPIFWGGLIAGLGLVLIICLVGSGLIYLNLRDTPTVTEPVLAIPPNLTATAVAATITANAPTPTIVSDPVDPAPTVTLAVPATDVPAATEPVTTATATAQPDDVTAARLTTPPTIDGSLGDWPGVATFVSAFRVFAAPEWDGSSDLEATWRLGWDEQNLYIGVTVTDDRHVQTQTGNQIYRGDSIDMQFDTDLNGDQASTQVSPDDYQIIFSAGDFAGIAPSAFRFRGTGDGQMLDFTGHSVSLAAQPQGEGYTIEAAIPWSNLGLAPSAGLTIGLALNANDNDTPNTAVQEVMMSHISTRTFRNPRTWGRLTLTP